jgi:hypothetical protein
VDYLEIVIPCGSRTTIQLGSVPQTDAQVAAILMRLSILVQRFGVAGAEEQIRQRGQYMEYARRQLKGGNGNGG